MFLQRLGFAVSGVDEFLIKSYAVWLHATVPFSFLISSLSGAVIKPFFANSFSCSSEKSRVLYTCAFSSAVYFDASFTSLLNFADVLLSLC